jgi:hypothetical protein
MDLSKNTPFSKGSLGITKSLGNCRLEFSSWSWAGWAGCLGDNFLYKDLKPPEHVDPRDLRPPVPEIPKFSQGTDDKDLPEFPLTYRTKDWHDYMSKLANIRVKTIFMHWYTIQCRVIHSIHERSESQAVFVTEPTDVESYEPEDGYLLQFDLKANLVLYLVPKWDLDGAQLEGKVLTCICFSDFRSDFRSDFHSGGWVEDVLCMLVVQETAEGLAERVGCCNLETRYVKLDGEWVYPQREHFWSILGKKIKRRAITLG